MTTEELTKKRMRRERNKVAAAKCRLKRRTHAQTVRQQHEMLSKSNEELVRTIRSLESEVDELHAMLRNHACVLSDEKRAMVEKEIEDEVRRTTTIVMAEGCRDDDSNDGDEDAGVGSIDENSDDSSAEE